MPAEQIIALLIAERDKLNRAIEALQGPAKRRGRPPKYSGTFTTPLGSRIVSETNAAPAPKKHGRRFSAAQRKAASERMRLRWALKRKAEAKSQPKTVSKSKKKAKAA